MRLRQYRNVETQASSAVSDFLENRQANAVAESLKANIYFMHYLHRNRVFVLIPFLVVLVMHTATVTMQNNYYVR